MVAQVIDVLQLVLLRREAQHELEARCRLHSKADYDKVAGIVRGCVPNPLSRHRQIGWSGNGGFRSRGLDVRFSSRPIEVKHFQTIHHTSVDVAHGLALPFGICTKTIPSWGSRTKWNNLWGDLAMLVCE